MSPKLTQLIEQSATLSPQERLELATHLKSAQNSPDRWDLSEAAIAKRNIEMRQVLAEWRETGDEVEQTETWEELKVSLDLDRLKSILQYQPIDTQTMILAAQLWAESRQRGTPTCDPRELDGDVILAAQAKQLEALGYEIIIVTTNIGHLSQFVTAKLWQDC
jgi:predicted nucleic acid-binding protein